MRRRLLLGCVLALTLLSCGGEGDLRDYYYPVRELTGGLVYEYARTGTLPGPDYEYRYFLGVDQDTALYLSTTLYSPTLAPEQLVRERIFNEGSVLESLTLLGADSAGVAIPAPADIERGAVFPFRPGGAAAPGGYRVRLTPPDNADATMVITLERRYRGDTTVSVLGGAAGAVVFDLSGEVSLRDPVEGDISPTFTGYEIYARGIGLVEYRRDLGAAGSLGGRLVRRLPMAEFAGAIPPAPNR